MNKTCNISWKSNRLLGYEDYMMQLSIFNSFKPLVYLSNI